MKLRTKFFSFLLLVTIIPSLTIITFFGVRITGIISANNDEYLSRLADERASVVNDYFNSVENAMFNLKTQNTIIDYLETVTPDNYQNVQSQIITTQIVEKIESFKSMNSFVNSIGVFSLNNGLDIYRGVYESDVISQINSDILIEKIKTDPQKTHYIISDSRSQHKYLLIINMIVDRYSDESIGYLVIKVNTQDFFDSLTESYRNKNIFLVYNAENEEVYHSTRKVEFDIRELSADKIVIDGVEYTVACRTIDSTGWKMFFLSDMTNFNREMTKTLLYTFCILGIFAVFTLSGAVYFYLKFYVPIRNLTDTMNSVGGDIIQVESPIKSKDELGRLGDAFDQLIVRVNNQMADIAKKEKQKNELEMDALQAQITPHFLYNTLNSIRSLAHLNKTEEIAHMSESLIDLLRIISSKKKNTSLAKECEYVNAYTDLMSIRSGNTYNVTIDLEENAKNIEVPKLTLQPFVENSIIHGGGSMDIHIRAWTEKDQVHIIISDNGNGMDEETLRRTNEEEHVIVPTKQHFRGIGIDNVRKRLKIEFGEESKVVLSMNVDGGIDVSICFPIKKV